MCGYICAYVSTVFLCLCTMPIGDHLNLQSHKKQAEGGKKKTWKLLGTSEIWNSNNFQSIVALQVSVR